MIPPSLEANPVLERWVRVEPDGFIRVAFGKVEYGQGTVTALAQIAAEELDVPFGKLRVANAATGAVPDEGMTVGSMSIEGSGASVRAACAEARALFLAEAAKRLGCAITELDILDGEFTRDGKGTGETYWTLCDAVDLNVAPTGNARWKTPDRHRLVGKSIPRLDLPAKMFGGGFIQDLKLPGMIHARVLRQPGPKATLAGIDEEAARRAANAAVGGEVDLDILVDGSFIAFISSRERAAAAAHDSALVTARWENERVLQPAEGTAEALKSLPEVFSESGADYAPSNRRQFKAAYSRPYISHGSLSPSCGIAHLENGTLTVWTHAQGVYPMQTVLERITGLEAQQIHVEHVQGAGTYGNNGADDAAFDAAVIAVRRPGKTVRVQWRREDEFGYAPTGTAMHMELTAELDDDGRIADWTSEVWSGPHPNRGRSLAELALPRVERVETRAPTPGAGGNPAMMRFSAARLNAIPAYDIPSTRFKEHFIRNTPIKVSSLRGLGGPPNIFAAECFVDELAETAGKDPVAYRLAMQPDARARTVIERVAAASNWSRRNSLDAGRGLGVAYDRHRDRGAYCAVVVEVTIDEEVRLEHIWCAVDCGLVINPDGAINQLEGGIVMAASWALKEEVKLGGNGITSNTWETYPILRFDEVPPIDVELVHMPNEPPWGTGEITQGATMAAIGNAVAQALGARIRSMPFTRDRVSAVLVRA